VSDDFNARTGFSGVPGRSSMPDWYQTLLDSVAGHVSTGHRRAVAAANHELIQSYWAIGVEILERQSLEVYGTKVVDRLSADLKNRFPGATGYSSRNLKYMRRFAEVWPDAEVVQRTVAQLPWRHQIALIEKLKDQATRAWYAAAAIEHGWSRDVLAFQIEGRLHERSGRAVTNFTATLPSDQSDLAQQATKDPYLFDFLATTEPGNERDLERGLIDHAEKFLLELGQGFAFVGRQVTLEIGGQEFFCDLLFYHFRLRRFVVIELKAVPFDPSFLGQLGMYMAAVDDLLGHPDDEPAIGLLLCKSKNDVVAEYALRAMKGSIGVAEWTTALTNSIPAELSSSLPTVAELEAELSDPVTPRQAQGTEQE